MTYLRIALIFMTIIINASEHQDTKLNVVFITLDDLSYESLGINGCKVPEISPHMDRIASSGLRFERFHVQASNCIPSRALMMTGMYQQKNKIFSLGKNGAGNQLIRNTISTAFRKAGYHTGIMGKNSHHNPFDPYTGFDVEYDAYGSTKYPDKVYEKTVQAIADSAKLGKPLFFNLNIYDPHVAWYGWSKIEGTVKAKENHPSRIYTPDEIPYPSWFPPLAESAKKGPTKRGKKSIHIKEEVTAYYNTVKRADDSIGQMLRAFDEYDLSNKTIFVLISDHGAELPGGKTTLYNEGTHSPLFISWPGVTRAATINDSELIGSIDLLPTFCEMLNQAIPANLDGRSFLPLIKGEKIPNWRPFVYIQQNDRNKARAIQTKDSFLYIVNAWHDGKTKFGSVSTGTLAWNLFKIAQKSPETDPLTTAWINKLEYRMPHELYDIKNDPACFKNLVNDPKYKIKLDEIRKMMIHEAEISGDHVALPILKNPQSVDARAQTVKAIDEEKFLRMTNPDYTRRAHYDPLDDKLVLGNSLFEEDANIWQVPNLGVSLSKTGGSREFGPGSVKIHAQSDEIIRLETIKALDASQYESIEYAFSLTPPQSNKNRKKKNSQNKNHHSTPKGIINFEYHDGSKWISLSKGRFSKFFNEQKHEFIAPASRFSENTKFAISFKFSDPGTLYLDGMRLAAKINWNHKILPKLIKLDSGQVFDLGRANSQQLELEINYNLKSNLSNGHLVLEAQKNGKWEIINEQNYSYVLQAKKYYSAYKQIKNLKNISHVRLKNIGPTSFEITNLEFKTR